MYQCPDCETAYDNKLETCPMCQNGDYSDSFEGTGLQEYTAMELKLNDKSFQKCSRCNAYVKTNTTVMLARHQCPICDGPTTKLHQTMASNR